MHRLSLSVLLVFTLLPADAAEDQPPSGSVNGDSPVTRDHAGAGLSDEPAELTEEERVRIRLFENSSPAVVRINAVPKSAETGPRQTGSGVVWDSDGHIVTSHHVVRDVGAVNVILWDGSTWQAVLTGTDPATDLAVLKIEAPGEQVHPLPVGNSDSLRVGQDAFAIGHPFSIDATLHAGIVSGLGRTVQSTTGRLITGVIQTDLAISPGDAGSPLLDRRGRIVGLNTSTLPSARSAARIGLAIPSVTLQRFVPDLIEHGKVIRPSLGIAIAAEKSAQQLKIEGVLVQSVLAGSPAATAGIRATRRADDGTVVIGDVIVAVDGKPVQKPADLLRALNLHDTGDEIMLTVRRDGREVKVSVKLQEFEHRAE